MSITYDQIQPIHGAGVWEHYTMRHGLPDMKIESVYEDSRGALWIGTHDRGVVRYDGYGFECFDRKSGLAGNGVYSAVEDAEGCLWFGTNHGLSRYDGKRFETIPLGEPCGFLWGSCRDQQGNLWFGLDRRPGRPAAVCRWDGTAPQLIELGGRARPAGESVHAVAVGRIGEIWVGGESLHQVCGGRVPPVSDLGLPADTGVSDIVVAPDGALWLATERGLLRRANGSMECLLASEGTQGPASLTVGADGAPWVATYGGAVIWYAQPVQLAGTVHATVHGGFSMDGAGRLWVGTYGMGLYCYDRTRMRVYGKEQGLPLGEAQCTTTEAPGTPLAGTRRGVYRSVARGFDEVADPDDGFQTEVTCLFRDREGRVWAGTRTGWLGTVEGDRLRRVTRVEEMRGYRIGCLAEDSAGRIWFGSPHGKGFGWWAEGKVTHFGPAPDAAYPVWIGALAADGEGGMWLGSANPLQWDGLCRWDGKVFQRVAVLTGHSVLSLCPGRAGLWVGTNEGLALVRGEEVRVFTQQDGLPYDIVTALAEGPDGTLWIGTEGGGVSCYDGQVLQVVQVPGEPRCNVVHAVHCDGEGTVWLATEGGLVRYQSRCVLPEVEVTRVVADATYPARAELQLPTSAGRVRFEFRGRSRQEDSSHLVYRYRLEGYEADWRQTPERQVDYGPLKPGDYTFVVQAVDRDLNYSEAAALRLQVVQDPRVEALTEALSSGTLRGEFVGESAALERVRRQVEEVAPSDLTVLILGETGTGKGLAARAVHELSARRGGPFVHVNCGGLQSQLVDSDLFGHERGAFTGAVARRLGRFELADGGTIFLDEIGDLPVESQIRLLHVLQERHIERVGGTRSVPVDVRVIAATNRDLPRTVREGGFREDLYYRLNVFAITIPPLRERKEDIPLLARNFVRQFAAHLHQQPPTLTDEVIGHLLGYEWPGNVRELEHTLQRGIILAGSRALGPEHLILGSAAAAPSSQDGDGADILPLEEYERRYLRRVLERTGGIIHGSRGAAILLGMKPTTLRSRLEKLGLK
ncbi:MAG: sigma 54-interacting transcriptional regulator [Candidatus Latescibacterota bacterium]